MRLNKYLIKLPLIFIALCLLGAIFNIANMTDSRYNARQSILSLSAHNADSQVLDNKTKPLTSFYKNLVEDVAEWKIPRGFKLTEAYFKTESETINVLSTHEKDSLDVALKGNTKFILKVQNKKSSITCDSITDIKLNEINLWEIANKIQVRIEDKKYFYISLALAGGFVLLLLFIKRSKGVLFIIICLVAFFILTLCKHYLKPEHFNPILGYFILRYMDVSCSVLILLILVTYYFVQSSVLAQYYEMHNIFSYQFKTYVVTTISILLSFFNHNLTANIINWFVWVPILQCYVFQNYEKILDKEEKKKIARRDELAEMVDEFDSMKIDDVEILHEYSDFHQRRRKNFRPFLMLIHLVLFIISLIVCFKNQVYFEATREVDQAMSYPFEVPGMSLLDIDEFVRNKENNSITFKIIKTEKPVVIDDISLITSNKVLEEWIKSFLKNVTFKRSLIVFKDLGKKEEYKLLDENNISQMTELNIKLLFIFETSENVMTTAEISIGENKVSTTLKNLNVITFGLKQNKYLGVLIFFNCLVLLLALIFTGGKDKSKLKFGLIVGLLVINLVFCFSFFYLIPRLVVNIKDEMKVMEGTVQGEDLTKFLNNVIKFMWMRKGVTLIVFLCILLIIIYVTISMPKEYSSYNKNMTSVKRAITSDWNNLRILSYQFLILILISSIIGHEAFGYKYDEFRNELLSLRYNFVMIFNKFLVEPKPDLKSLLYLYHRFAIFVFYNVVLTGFLATFYFHSCTKRQLWFQKTKNFFVFPKPSDFNFDVKIKATFDEILAFKVFLKSFESYREHISMNISEKGDSCNHFVETFTQSKQGLSKLTFNGDLIKINSYNSKIKKLEKQKDNVVEQNDNKREYLILLQKKLRETTDEIERFRSKNKILDLIDSNKINKGNNINRGVEGVDKDKPYVNAIKIKKYDTRQLETFITNPKSKKVLEEHQDSQTVVNEQEQNVDNNRVAPGDVRKLVRQSSKRDNKDKLEYKEQENVVLEKKENEQERIEEVPNPDDNENKEDNQSKVNNECSTDKPSDESENKTQNRVMLKRPEKKRESIDIGIFKKRILKDL